MMFLISLLLGIVPLVGIGWMAQHGSFTSVDGLFTALILLTLSGILFLNTFLDIRKKMYSKSPAPLAQKKS